MKKNDIELTYEDFFREHKYSYFKFLIQDKDFERFVLLILILSVSFFICFKKKKFENNFYKFNSIFLILSGLSFLFWLFVLPQTRYGGNIVLLVFISSIFNFFFYSWKFSLSKISKLFLISLFAFMITKNLLRIKNEIIFAKKNNLNFPFKSLNDYEVYNLSKFDMNFIITNHKRYCIDTKKLCITKESFDAIDDIYEKNTYKIVKSNKHKLIQAQEVNFMDYKEDFMNYK